MALDAITNASDTPTSSENRNESAAFKSRRAPTAAPRTISRPVQRRQPEPTGMCFDALSDRLTAMRITK